MSRNRYTRLIHEQDEARLDTQLRELRRLACTLQRQLTETVELPVEDQLKMRRRARLEQKRRRTLAPIPATTAA